MSRPTTTRVYLFDHLENAHTAVDRLIKQGALPGDLGLVTRDESGHAVADASQGGRLEPLDPIQTRTFSERAAKNGARGALVGGLIGMLGGLAALAVPGAGPVLFVGSVAGVVAGGLLSALSTHIIHEHEAVVFEEALRRGGTLLFVHDAAAALPALGEIVVAAGATHLPSRITEWRAQGWTGYEPPPLAVEGAPAAEPPREDFFRHADPEAEDPWVKAYWQHLVSPLRSTWPLLKGDDLAAIDGHRGRLVMRIRDLYGDSQETVDWRLDELMAEVLGTPAIQDSPSAHRSWTQEGVDGLPLRE